MSRLPEAQLLAGGDADLLLHDVDAGDELGHRMLDLHARVHLDEEELVVLVQELEGAGAAVADLAAGVRAALADADQRAQRQPGRGRLLDDLLVPALHRAVALEEIHRVLVLVGQHLDLDVARLRQELLHVDRRIAERGVGLGLGQVHRGEQRRFGVDDAHAAPAAAAGGLDDHRIADLAGDLDDLLRVVGKRAGRTGHAGNAGLGHRGLRAHLVAHEPDRVGARADEDEARPLDLFREVRVLREKAVAGMDRLRVGHLGRGDDRRNVEVAQRRGRRPDAHRLVGEPDVLGLAVGFGVDDDGPDAELAARALDAQRDLAAIGDQNLAEELVRILRDDRRRGGAQGQFGPSADHDQRLAEFDGLPVLHEDFLHDARTCRSRSRS